MKIVKHSNSTPLVKSFFSSMFDSFFQEFEPFFTGHMTQFWSTSEVWSTSEDGKQAYCRMDLPGFKSEDFSVKVEDKQLSITAKSSSKDGARWQSNREVSYSVNLPSDIDSTSIEAEYSSGVLVLTANKKVQTPESKSKQIPVKAG